MYNIDKIAKQDKRRWNGKVITTSNQWNWNADGSAECTECRMSLDGIIGNAMAMIELDRCF